MIYRSLPYWPINFQLSSSPWIDFQLDLARCLWAISRDAHVGRQLSARSRLRRTGK